MINIDPRLGMKNRCREIEAMVKEIMSLLVCRHGLALPELNIVWEEDQPSLLAIAARVEEGILYLNKPILVILPYMKALRETPVTLELGTPTGKKTICLPYGKILDWFQAETVIPFQDGIHILTDDQIKGEIAGALVTAMLDSVGGWLASNSSDALCLRNGIVSVYQSLISRYLPTAVGDKIWDIYDPNVRSRREVSGGYHLLIPYLADYYTCSEVIRILEEAGQPRYAEILPLYIKRVFSSQF